MRSSKHGIKALGLAIMVAVLGTMALGAVGAQAQLPGESEAGTYLINLSEALLAAVVGQSGLGSLLIPGRNLKLECHQGHAESVKVDSSTDALGKVTFLECVSLALDSGNPLPCETVGLGTISATYLALPISHAGEAFVLFEPQGTAFTTISYKEGTECPMPQLQIQMTGSITAEVSELEGVSPTLTFSPTIQLLTGDVLRYGGFPTYIHGSATVELTGEHEGQKLGSHGKVKHLEAEHLEVKHLEAEHLEVKHLEVKHLEAEHLEAKHLHSELLHLLSLHEPTLKLNPEPLAKPSETSTLGSFLINLGSALLATTSARQIGLSVLLVAGRNLEIRCTALTVNSAKITTSVDASLETTFTGCKAFSHQTLKQLPCQFVELETIKAKALVLPTTHGEEGFLLFEPQEGNSFTTVSFKEGTECPLPLNNPVTGSVSALVDALDAVTQLISFASGIQLLTGDVLRFGGFPSYVKAHGEIEAVGDHEGQKLGVH